MNERKGLGGESLSCLWNILNFTVESVVFNVVINTDCEGFCYRIYRGHYWGFFAGHISSNKHPHSRYLLLL